MEIKETLLNRLGIADAMAHRAKASAGRLQQAAAKHHDAANADIDALGRQIEAAGVGEDEDAENRYCRALVARGHMAQAHHLAGLDAARMPEVGLSERSESGASLEKGRISQSKAEAAGQAAMEFDEEKHPREAKGDTMAGYKPGEFVPKETPENTQPEEFDRELDWRLNGVRGKAFKSWFGDWEDDPKNASKVLNEKAEPAKNQHLSKVAGKDGKPSVVYHGTGKGGFRTWDKDKTNWNGLYGGGFYFTEDREVADEYTKKESPVKLDRDLTDKDMKAAERFLLSAKVQSQVREDIGLAERFKQTVRAWKSGKEHFQQFLEAGPTQNGPFHILTALNIGSTFAANAETFEVYLNIRKPLDVDSEATEEQIRQFHGALGKDHPDQRPVEEWDSLDRGPKYGPPSWGEVFEDAISSPSPEDRGEQWKSVYRALAAMGHDGLTHIGGGRFNTADGNRHRVWIAFEPNQIKSAENDGTFDPNDPDMYKAVRSACEANELCRPFVPPDMPTWTGDPQDPYPYLPLNFVEDRDKCRAMAEQMAAGTWTWNVPLIRCGDQLLTGSHRFIAAKATRTPLKVMDISDLFKEGGLDFEETWKQHAQPYDGWRSNLDYALKCLPPELLDHYGVDLG